MQPFEIFRCFRNETVLHSVGFSHFPQVSMTASPLHNLRDNSSLSEEDRKVSLRPSLPQTMAPQTLRPQEEGCFHLSLMWLANRAKRTDNRTMTRVGFSLEAECIGHRSHRRLDHPLTPTSLMCFGHA